MQVVNGSGDGPESFVAQRRHVRGNMARRAEEDARSEKAGRIVGAGAAFDIIAAGTREDCADQDHPVTASASKRQRIRPKTLSRREMQREKRRREKAGERLEIIPYQRPSTRSSA